MLLKARLEPWASRDLSARKASRDPSASKDPRASKVPWVSLERWVREDRWACKASPERWVLPASSGRPDRWASAECEDLKASPGLPAQSVSWARPANLVPLVHPVPPVLPDRWANRASPARQVLKDRRASREKPDRL